MALRTLSVCAGVGGLDLGVRIARPDARCVAFVEREASAAASLVASMAAGRLHPAAVWSDLRTFDAPAWRGAVDCVLSGDPCQGNSVAGKRLGADDDRWLLDRAIDVFDQSGAHTFFRENVPGNLHGQLEAAIPALERLGCHVAAGIFSAAEAGASHRRERLFILAKRRRNCPGCGGRGRIGPFLPGGISAKCGNCVAVSPDERHEWAGDARGWRYGPADSSVRLDDAQRTERREDSIPRDREGQDACSSGRDEGAAGLGASSANLAFADGAGSQGRRGCDGPLGRQVADGHAGLASGVLASARRDRPFAPGPSDPVWAEIIRDAPSLEPAVCRVAHGVAGRIERLRHCGNGVVPLTAALAWVRLHGLLADAAAGDAVRFADDRSASAGAVAVRAAA